MKTRYAFTRAVLITAWLLNSQLSVAQNFAPFNASVTKRFYNAANGSDNDYFFYADSISQPTTDLTIFYQYFTVQQANASVDDSDCGFWSGPMYMADTTWLGVEIFYHKSTEILMLKNSNGEILAFDFSLSPGDSAKFFENATDKYFIKAGTTQNESVYTVSDAVKTYTVLHYNSGNQVVNSNLHGKLIKLGQQTGLIRFLDVYNFPGKETALTLQGQLNPLIGSYQMRFEDLYPFQVGDNLQFHGSSTAFCIHYRSYVVTARTETTDSVTLTFKKSIHYLNSVPPPTVCATLDIYPDQLTFKKNSDIMGYPYNSLNETGFRLSLTNLNNTYETRNEDSSLAICGKRQGYRGETHSAKYCAGCVCVGSIDAFQKPLPYRQLTAGAGTTYFKVETWNGGGNQLTQQMSLVYMSVGGTTCGTYFPVGISEYQKSPTSIYPSPVSDVLSIGSPIDQLDVFTADGQFLESFLKPRPTVAVDHLVPGLYLFRLKSGNSVTHTRIIVQ